MDVALKIWRFDPETGERALKRYEVEAPEWACLLDVLDIVKDQVDGTLAYRKSCRMMICGSCGMRMDGRAVLACKERMKPIVDARPRPGHLGDGEHAGRQGPRRRHGPLLAEDPRDEAVGRDRATRSTRSDGVPSLAGADEPDPQGGALHHVRLLRLRVQLDGVRPGVPRAGGAREGLPLRRRPARPERRSSGSSSTTPSTGSGTARAATSATSAARRASTRATRSRSSAPSRSRRGSTATWARSTRSGSSTPPMTTGWLRETELVPKTQGVIAALKETKFAISLAKKGKVPLPVPAARGRQDVHEARAAPRPDRRRRAATARSGTSRASARSRGSSTRHGRSRQRAEADAPRSRPARRPSTAIGERHEQRSPTTRAASALAVGEGARHVDAGARAEARARARGARVGHLLRRRRHPRGRARLLPPPERADPRLRRGDGRRHADDDLQRLHAQPAPGEPHAPERRRRSARG